MMKKTKIVTLAALLMMVGGAGAASISITNHSFEGPDTGGSYLNGLPDDWSLLSGNAGFVENSNSIGFTNNLDGVQTYGSRNSGIIYQDLGVAYAPNTTYTVDLSVAHRGGSTNGTSEFGLFSSDALGTDLTGATVGFVNGQAVWTVYGNTNTFFDTADGSLNPTVGNSYTFTTGASVPSGNVVVFVRNASGTTYVDNIRLDATAVPEPASSALFALGSLAWIIRRRR